MYTRYMRHMDVGNTFRDHATNCMGIELGATIKITFQQSRRLTNYILLVCVPGIMEGA